MAAFPPQSDRIIAMLIDYAKSRLDLGEDHPAQ
jgi:hypothetical protein